MDDEIHWRVLLTTLFKTAGYEIVVARDGREGMRQARFIKPDLIILDVMMPGEGGVPMYRQIRTDETLKNVPVLMLSGVEDRVFTHALKMMSAGLTTPLPDPERYVEKPPAPEELLRVARELLGDAA